MPVDARPLIAEDQPFSRRDGDRRAPLLFTQQLRQAHPQRAGDVRGGIERGLCSPRSMFESVARLTPAAAASPPVSDPADPALPAPVRRIARDGPTADPDFFHSFFHMLDFSSMLEQNRMPVYCIGATARHITPGSTPCVPDTIKQGIERAPHRGLLRATGQIRAESDFGKPFIAICNSYVDIIPGHVHLQEFGRVVKEAVRAAGGIPFEFNTIGVDDGIAMGHEGMRYSLPSRELIADCVETMVDGALLRRHDLHPQLRQDYARHADGRDARGYPHHLRLGRADAGGPGRSRATAST